MGRKKAPAALLLPQAPHLNPSARRQHHFHRRPEGLGKRQASRTEQADRFFSVNKSMMRLDAIEDALLGVATQPMSITRSRPARGRLVSRLAGCQLPLHALNFSAGDAAPWRRAPHRSEPPLSRYLRQKTPHLSDFQAQTVKRVDFAEMSMVKASTEGFAYEK